MEDPITPHHNPAEDASGSPYPGEPGTPGEGGALPPASSSSSSASSSLDTTETTVSDPVAAFLARGPDAPISNEITLNTTSECSRFRHGGWWKIRTKIFDALKRTKVADSRLRSFASCGVGSWIEQSDLDATRFRMHCNHCHDRLCTPCANQRSWRLTQALMAMIKDRETTFITLTLCGKGEPLKDLVDRLYKHFRALRLHPLWEENIAGGAAFLEVKWSDRAQRWHPHLHIICEAKWIEQGELSAVWRGITKDSYIVDIRKVREKEQTAHYVTKYASKPLNMSFANTPELLDEAILALKGRRLCLCFGTWYGTPLDALEDTELADDLIDSGGWHTYADLESIIKDANAGDKSARDIIVAVGGESRWRSSLLIDR